MNVVRECVAGRLAADRVPCQQYGIAMISKDRARLATVVVVREQHGRWKRHEAIIGARLGNDALDLCMAWPQARDRDTAQEENRAVPDSADHCLKIEVLSV